MKQREDKVGWWRREGVKVLVGGRPVTEEYAQEIGADGYAPDAIAAKSMMAKLLDTATD